MNIKTSTERELNEDENREKSRILRLIQLMN